MLEAVPPTGSDPIDSDDPAVLRREVLRLRDLAYGEQARADLQTRRVEELEQELHQIGDHAASLQAQLARTPSHQARRVVGRLQRMVQERR